MSRKPYFHSETDEYYEHKPSAREADKYRKLNPFKRETYEPLEPFEKRAILRRALVILVLTAAGLVWWCCTLNASKEQVNEEFNENTTVSQSAQDQIDVYGQNAARVRTGTYIENITAIDMKNSSFTVDMLLWFRWDGHNDLDMTDHFRLYRGTIQSITPVKEVRDGNTNYQVFRIKAQINKNFQSVRFPLGSHVLKIYVESTYTIDNVVLTADTEESSVNKHISIYGFDLVKSNVGTTAYKYDKNDSDPELEAIGADGVLDSEMVTSLLINRNGWGLFFRCFIAMYGTLIFVMITLYINTYHRLDPLSMLPSALFGAVGNIMVGANLLPDVLTMGLLEFVNFYGIAMILASMGIVITVNRIRKAYEDRYYAAVYGVVMFYLMAALIIGGNIILPLSAYQFF